MGVTSEMIAANVRNWLQDLAIGAKAVNTKMMCGVAKEGEEWKVEASTYEEETAVTEISLRRTETVRRWWPYLRDRRIDAYSDILKRCADNR